MLLEPKPLCHNYFMLTIRLVLLLVLSLSVGCISARKAPPSAWRAGQPRRVLVIVMDQFRRDFLDRFPLPNLRRLQKQSVDFTEATVGHLTSNTVVSHPVLTTGLYPKNLPWVDHLGRDVLGRIGKRRAMYSPLDLHADQFQNLLAGTDSVSLLSRIPGEPSQKLVVAQKAYAAYSFAAPATVPVLTLGPKQAEGELKGWRFPVGLQVPDYFTEPRGGRFYLNANETYGSERTLYPLDGQRFIPGSDPKHLGGDVWVADAALEFMKRQPNWTALWVSFGALDKVLHMLAEHEKPSAETWAAPEVRLAAILTELDNQIGRLLSSLEEQDALKETIIVATSDHGGQESTEFHGTQALGRGLEYLQYGKGTNFEFTGYPPALAPLIKTGLVEAMTHDTAISIFAKKTDRDSLQRIVAPARKLPGTAEIYLRENVSNRYYYVRVFRAPDLSDTELEYAKLNHQSLVDTMAGAQGPEILILLKDGYGYGLKGDHGGAQRQVQSIPLLFWSPELKPIVSEEAGPHRSRALVRLVDINAMVSYALGLSPPSPTDGTATPLTPFLTR